MEHQAPARLRLYPAGVIERLTDYQSPDNLETLAMINRYRFVLNSTRRYRSTGPRDWPLWADYERSLQEKSHGTIPREMTSPEPEPISESSPRQRRDDPPQTPPSDQTNAPTDSVSTPISPAPLSVLASAQGPANPSITGNSVVELPGQSPAPHPPLRQLVELWMKREGIVYVNVENAKKALFAGAKLESFHFLAHRPQGPHWLIWAGKINAETRADMLQWERIFGEGFKAVLARRSQRNPLGFVTKTLADEPINW